MPKENKKLEQQDLDQFTGTERYYLHWAKKVKFTDGVKYLAEKGGAFWLIDAIASYQDNFKKIHFQVWELTVNQTAHTGILTMKEDTNKPILVEQVLEFTDFPLSKVALWLIDGILILPSEY